MPNHKDETLHDLRATVYEMWRDIHGFRPRHIDWSNISDDELMRMHDDLLDAYESDDHKQRMQDDKDEIASIERYELEDQLAKAEDHPEDFYDTMDFKKDKAKLRDFNPKLESLIRKLVSEQINDHSKSLGFPPSDFSMKHSNNKVLFDIFYERFPNKQAMSNQKNIMKALSDAFEAGKKSK